MSVNAILISKGVNPSYFTLSEYEVELGPYINSTTVTINKLNSNSSFTVSSSNTSVATVSISGTTITITKGSTVGSASITVKESTTSKTATISVEVTSSLTFTWDSASWEEVQNLCKARADGTITSTQFNSVVAIGNTKVTTLSTAVLGASSATMEVIGIDQDATGTLTFQSKYLLPTTTVFGSSAVWTNSTAKTQCSNFYSYCDAKSYIKSLSKGTCLTQTSGQNGTATYATETVWIPSEGEVNLDSYSSLKKSNWTTSNAECTSGKSFNYSKYSDNSSRIKYIGTSSGESSGSASGWWLRSRHYNYSTNVCYVGSSGGAYGNVYNAGAYLAPVFCIG